jgi:hypothetical protein
MNTIRDIIEEEIDTASEDYYGRRGYPRPGQRERVTVATRQTQET